jgi:hypothetical protein
MQKQEGLRGNQALYEANRKQQAAKEQAEYETLLESPLKTPPADTPTASAQGKIHPPLTVAKATTRNKRSSKASLATKLDYSSTSSEDANTAE